MHSSFDVVVLANQHNRTFWPFSGMISPALLPLAGKPLISCLLEILAGFAPLKIGIAICPWDKETAAEAIRRHWPNLTIELLADLSTHWPGAGLVLRADIVPDQLAIASHMQKPVRKQRSRPNAWLKAATVAQADTSSVKDCLLPDAAAYFRMAMLAQGGSIPGLLPEGWIDDDGIRVGTNTTILTRRSPGLSVSVGSNAYVDKSVQLGDFSIVGDGAYISQGAWIKHSIVLPQCFVPPGMKLENSIVCRQWVYNVINGDFFTTQSSTAALSVA